MTPASMAAIPLPDVDAAERDTPGRIAALDIVRGVAVMGILAMNIVGFGMPFAAYMNPLAYGTPSDADLASWLLSFIFIDGKMRGLFSFLFGASTLLVIERATASGASAASIHYRRMFWLLLFGLAHFYLIWFGDILVAYALCGMVLFLFRDLAPRGLVLWGIGLLVVQMLFLGSFGASALYMSTHAATLDAETARQWQELQQQFGPQRGTHLADNLALHLGPWAGLVHHRLFEQGANPFIQVLFFGAETIAYMLFGMAALKSGFFRGEWQPARYRKIALVGLAIAVPVYAAMAWLVASHDFDVGWVIAVAFAATVPFRPVMIYAYAALIILLTRNGGALVERIAAAGRAAFTNYLGTSLLMTTLFYGYGLGLYGSLSRIALWIPVIATWALMLLWSKPWLERFRYGPFEWLWRSLARWEFQPMRRAPT
ncbi:DUF418 domain-containing protein [Sphingosinicella sp. LHD-64]|uniref:DUF418 domain-containing protein n=1 Tax=Sphingosinicella sp. LHD-64 TaxID=3072139 RepID=UPI00280C8ECA|nr:DUF418 domain-containing protein [Sphingosinicella sp. LHD-64]MDQ8755705.1 DUF418 domain-containing protein [Sphingosinicella sp. LHD-64]